MKLRKPLRQFAVVAPLGVLVGAGIPLAIDTLEGGTLPSISAPGAESAKPRALVAGTVRDPASRRAKHRKRRARAARASRSSVARPSGGGAPAGAPATSPTPSPAGNPGGSPGPPPSRPRQRVQPPPPRLRPAPAPPAPRKPPRKREKRVPTQGGQQEDADFDDSG